MAFRCCRNAGLWSARCAWFTAYRRLSKDYEYDASSSESMVYLASIRLMLRRLIKHPALPGLVI